MGKSVLVTGVTGQDGANMCEYLLNLNAGIGFHDKAPKEPYSVYGMVRRSSQINTVNCEPFLRDKNFHLVSGDLTDSASIDKLVKEIQPDYIINFAANSFVGCSWDMPLHVLDTNTGGVARFLESIKKFKRDCRFYSAGSSEEFGDVDYVPQDMKHPIKPRSPYGASKAAARHLVKVYRESYGIFAIHGILFNHEGTKRGEEFVTRKITKGVAKIYHAIKEGRRFDPIQLGNLSAMRDWSDSEDFVKGVWLMINQEEPKEYILASGETHTISEFVERAFSSAGIKGEWSEAGEDINGQYVKYPQATKFVDSKSKKVYIEISEKFYRPAEVNLLMGDPKPAKKELGWRPNTSFKELVRKMVKHDIEKEDNKSIPLIKG